MTTRKLPRISLFVSWILAYQAGCDSTPADPELPPLGGDVARFPDSAEDSEISPQAADNPWIDGFGGAAAPGIGAPDSPDDVTAPPLVPTALAPDSGGGDAKPDVPDDSMSAEPGSDPVGDPTDDPPHPLARRFTRYLEGEGSDKLLGIWGEHGTSPVPCEVQIYSNGGTMPWRSVPLPDAFPETGEVVLCSLPELHPECSEPMSGSLYNGNDALVLQCGDSIHDAFGRVGEDPGSAWVSVDELIRSEGQHLVRCGDDARQDPLAPFAIEEEWLAVQNGESPEAALLRCAATGAFGLGGAGAL